MSKVQAKRMSRAKMVHSRTIWCLKLAVQDLENGLPQDALELIARALGSLKLGRK